MLFIFIPLSVIAALLSVVYLWADRSLTAKRVTSIGVAMVVVPFFANDAFQFYWYRKAIPENIRITYPISMHDETGFREGCGTIVFKVADDTIEAIDRGGLKFLAGATQGQGHPGDRYYRYAEWKETPVPPSWTSEGSWMPCSGLSHSEHRKIVSAATSRGAYYTTKDEAQLVLIPSLGYIVYSFFG